MTEKNGVATTLTSFTVNGVNNLGRSASLNIPANGTIRANLSGNSLAAPLNRVFVFSGKDADGTTWTQSITVPFLPPANGATPLNPAVTLTTTTPVVFLNPTADPSCQWAQQLTVQETGGFYMVLTKLTIGNSDISSQLPVIFGTTRLAPYGLLQGTLCLSNTTASGAKAYTLTTSLSPTEDWWNVDGATASVLSERGDERAIASVAAFVTLSVGDDSPWHRPL